MRHRFVEWQGFDFEEVPHPDAFLPYALRHLRRRDADGEPHLLMVTEPSGERCCCVCGQGEHHPLH